VQAEVSGLRDSFLFINNSHNKGTDSITCSFSFV